MEASKRGALPGGYMDPTRLRRTRAEDPAPPSEPERYDPFNAG